MDQKSEPLGPQHLSLLLLAAFPPPLPFGFGLFWHLPLRRCPRNGTRCGDLGLFISFYMCKVGENPTDGGMAAPPRFWGMSFWPPYSTGHFFQSSGVGAVHCYSMGFLPIATIQSSVGGIHLPVLGLPQGLIGKYFQQFLCWFVFRWFQGFPRDSKMLYNIQKCCFCVLLCVCNSFMEDPMGSF